MYIGLTKDLHHMGEIDYIVSDSYICAIFRSYFFTVRNACNAMISPMIFTLVAEIGSENNSLSLRYFPFENFVTNISIFRYTSEVDRSFFGQKAKVHRTVEGKYLSVNMRKSIGKRKIVA